MRCIGTGSDQQHDDLQDEDLGELRKGPQQGGALQGEEPDDDKGDDIVDDKGDDKGELDVGAQDITANVVHASQIAIRQPPGECDPESDLTCSFS